MGDPAQPVVLITLPAGMPAGVSVRPTSVKRAQRFSGERCGINGPGC